MEKEKNKLFLLLKKSHKSFCYPEIYNCKHKLLFGYNELSIMAEIKIKTISRKKTNSKKIK